MVCFKSVPDLSGCPFATSAEAEAEYHEGPDPPDTSRMCSADANLSLTRQAHSTRGTAKASTSEWIQALQWAKLMPQANPAYTEEERDGFRRDPGGICEHARGHVAGLLRRLLERRGRRELAADADDRGAVPAEPRDQRARSGAARAAPAELPRGVQAAGHLARLLRSDPAPERGARHLGDRADRAEGRAHRRRPAARARRAGARDRLPRRPLHAADPGRRPGRREPRRRLGRAADRVPVHLHPRLPEPVHAERPERARGELLADRGGRAADRLHPPARGADPDGRCRAVAPSAGATAAFDAARTDAAKTSIWSTGCKSWYLDHRGIPASWPWTFDRFREEMSRPKLECYVTRD